MLNGPDSAPVSATSARFSQPAFGPASRIQPTAPRYGGMMKVPRIEIQMSPLNGMSVRDSAQAIGTPNSRHMRPEERPSNSELPSASRWRRRL